MSYGFSIFFTSIICIYLKYVFIPLGQIIMSWYKRYFIIEKHLPRWIMKYIKYFSYMGPPPNPTQIINPFPNARISANHYKVFSHCMQWWNHYDGDRFSIVESLFLIYTIYMWKNKYHLDFAIYVLLKKLMEKRRL